MNHVLPLMRCWTICAPILPDGLLPTAHPRGFSLPGAEDLSAFADLLGTDKKPARTGKRR